MGRRERHRARAAVAPTTTARSSAASSATSTASKSLDEVGVDNITFETDYPHTDSTWPHTKKVAEEMVAGIDDESVYKIMRGNAIRMLHLDLAVDRLNRACSPRSSRRRPAASAPTAAFVDADGTSLSYAELDRRSDAAAVSFRALGIGEGAVVALDPALRPRPTSSPTSARRRPVRSPPGSTPG